MEELEYKHPSDIWAFLKEQVCQRALRKRLTEWEYLNWEVIKDCLSHQGSAVVNIVDDIESLATQGDGKDAEAR